MESLSGKMVLAVALVAFLAATLFGAGAMALGGMQSDCPFSAGSALCVGGVSGAVHHLASASAFTNVPVAVLATLALLSLLLAAALLAFLYRPLLFRPPPLLFAYGFYAPPRPHKLIRWLSRTERSPSR